MRKILIAFLVSFFILFGALWALISMDKKAIPAEPNKKPDIQLIEETIHASITEVFHRKHVMQTWIDGLKNEHDMRVDHFTVALKVLSVDSANVKDEVNSTRSFFAVGTIKTVIAFGFIENKKVRYIHTAGILFLIDNDIKIIDLTTVFRQDEILIGWGEGLDC